MIDRLLVGSKRAMYRALGRVSALRWVGVAIRTRATPKFLRRGAWSLLLLAAWCGAANAERRVALVIGNASYQSAALKNPLRDAADVSRLLRQLDFDVIVENNLSKIKTEEVLRRFAGMLNGADVAIFYYSGHAVQLNDRNYLVPISTSADEQNIATLDAFALQDVSEIMAAANVKVQILVLDACRDNPFGKAFAPRVDLGRKRGLAPVTSPVGTLVAFATSPGMAAFDGSGSNSPFTESFLRHASVPKLEIRQVLSRIRADVVEASRRQQVPWDSSSLIGDFFLVPPRAPPAFERSVAVDYAPDTAGSPLRLKRPILPDGGTLSISIIDLPDGGVLELGNRSVAPSDRLSADDFERLAYRPAKAEHQYDGFSFRLDDSWGNSATGHVSLRARAAVPASVEKPAAVPIGDVRLTATSTIGIGPNLSIEAPSVPPSVGLRLASNMAIGQFQLNGRVIDQDRTIVADDVRRLTFLPPPGANGKAIEADFRAVEPATGRIRLSVRMTASDCDLLAGAPFDPQGVTEGVTSARINTKAALAACEKAVSQHPKSGRFLFELARVLQALGRTAEAVERFRQATDLGHIRARTSLATMYVDGSGVAKDLATARRELEIGIGLDDVAAMHVMAKLYLDGQGVDKDQKRARELLERAARVGYPPSITELGVEYALGRSVKRDTSIARRYFEEASKRGDIYATQNLGTVFLDGIGTSKNLPKALAYFRQASDLGHPESPNNIGRMYFSGLGVAIDRNEARRWYKLGSDRGDGWASVNNGRLAESQKNNPGMVEAAIYYARAASFSQPDAAALGRKQLGKLARGIKMAGLRQLVSQIDSPSGAAGPEAAVLTLGRRIASNNQVALDGADLDAILIACARADWLRLGVRTDLF